MRRYIFAIVGECYACVFEASSHIFQPRRQLLSLDVSRAVEVQARKHLPLHHRGYPDAQLREQRTQLLAVNGSGAVGCNISAREDEAKPCVWANVEC